MDDGLLRTGSSNNKVAEAVMFLGEAVWAESGDSAALHRATSELFALAVQIGSDTFAAFLITQVMKHLAETPSPQKCASAVACVPSLSDYPFLSASVS